MTNPSLILSELVDLSHWLGAPGRDCVILAEGNTSARLDDETFLVKASGSELGGVEPKGFVEVRRADILAMLRLNPFNPQQTRLELAKAKVDPGQSGEPSIETPLHAICLGLPGVAFVGHTHPVAINALVCSQGFEQVLSQRIYPDQVIACGPRSLQVPFAEPGMALGKALQQSLSNYLERWGEPPKTIYLRNHGFVALGASADEVKGLTQMAIKAARILAGTAAFGGPAGMDSIDVDSMH